MGVLSAKLYAINSSTQGTNFYLSFIPNDSRYSSSDLTLIFSAKNDCTVTISGEYYNSTVNVSGGGTAVHTIMKHSFACPKPLVVSNAALHIVSTDTISLYTGNYIPYSFDANNVLPTSALGSKYMVASYFSISNLSSQKPSALIVATEKDTRVNITPRIYRDSVVIGTVKNDSGKCDTTFHYLFHHPHHGMILVDSMVTNEESNNLRLTYKLPSYGSTITTPIMNARQVFLYVPSGGEDLTGTIIEAQDCKKIALFSGHQRTSVGIPLSTSYSSDHLTEQMLPFNALGKNFVLVPTMDRIKDRVRIIASENDTEITIHNNTYHLQQGAFYETDLSTISFMKSSKPVITILHPISIDAPDGNIDSNIRLGDNSMIWVNPIEQTLPDIIFATLPTRQITNHYVNVVVKTSSVEQTSFNGINIASSFSPVPNNSTYSYARIGGLDPNIAHRLQNPQGLAAYVYGYGDAEAYGYTAGSNVKDLQFNFFVEGILSDELDGITFLEKDTLQLSTTVDNTNPNISIEWTTDGSIQNGTIIFNSAGCRTISLTISDSRDICISSRSISRKICIRPLPIKIPIIPDVCQGQTLTNAYFEDAQNIKWYDSETSTVGS
ncbi:MAG: IgGFc-binding protein, partial [Bacteroidales bacterium]